MWIMQFNTLQIVLGGFRIGAEFSISFSVNLSSSVWIQKHIDVRMYSELRMLQKNGSEAQFESVLLRHPEAAEAFPALSSVFEQHTSPLMIARNKPSLIPPPWPHKMQFVSYTLPLRMLNLHDSQPTGNCWLRVTVQIGWGDNWPKYFRNWLKF